MNLAGVQFDQETDGAGVLVIVDDGSGPTVIAVRDGMDHAYITAPPNPADPIEQSDTVPQTFDFAASPVDRTVRLQ